MTAAELRDKSTDELRELGTEKREELFRLRMQQYTGQLDQPSLLKTTRKDIARIETVLRERALADDSAA
jgi:ribosomal protein L29